MTMLMKALLFRLIIVDHLDLKLLEMGTVVLKLQTIILDIGNTII